MLSKSKKLVKTFFFHLGGFPKALTNHDDMRFAFKDQYHLNEKKRKMKKVGLKTLINCTLILATLQ